MRVINFRVNKLDLKPSSQVERNLSKRQTKWRVLIMTTTRVMSTVKWYFVAKIVLVIEKNF